MISSMLCEMGVHEKVSTLENKALTMKSEPCACPLYR